MNLKVSSVGIIVKMQFFFPNVRKRYFIQFISFLSKSFLQNVLYFDGLSNIISSDIFKVVPRILKQVLIENPQIIYFPKGYL